MEKRSLEFQIFAKPVGSECNLSCSYCYYPGKNNPYRDKGSFLMADDILELYIRQHIQATTDNTVNFSWHGGEPLLAGIDFFRKILRLQAANNPAGKKIVNGVQTNGTLINDEWARFFKRENFVIGISVDGPAWLHDNYRRNKGNKATWMEVDRGFRLLKKQGVIPEILCVINAKNGAHPMIIYDLFRQMGAKYITFLPLVVRDASSASGASEDSVGPDKFGHFLSTIFDEWVENDIGEIKIQIFEEAARTAFDQDHTLCIFKKDCGGVPVVEHNGDFYSCDHYVNRDHLLGNIMDHSITYFLDSERQKAFGKVKSLTLPNYCTGCEVRPMCNGECPKNRFILTPDGEPGLNYLCSGYKYFFNHIKPFIEAISEAWKKQQA